MNYINMINYACVTYYTWQSVGNLAKPDRAAPGVVACLGPSSVGTGQSQTPGSCSYAAHRRKKSFKGETSWMFFDPTHPGLGVYRCTCAAWARAKRATSPCRRRAAVGDVCALIYCMIASVKSLTLARNSQIGLWCVPGTPQETRILAVWAGAYADFQGPGLPSK